MASGNSSFMEVVPSLPPLHINLNSTLGVAFIGLIFAAILFGISNVQSLIYYQSSARDPKYMRRTIALLWLLDALQLAMISHALYFYMVTNFSDVSAIAKITWSLSLEVIMTAISDTLVRLYYVWRVWTMSEHNRILTAGAVAIALLNFITVIGIGVKSFTLSYLPEISKISWLVYTGFISGVVVDLWIAVTLCFFLVKGRTCFGSTNSTINALIVYVISTGLLTALCAITMIVTYAAMPKTYIFVGLYFTLPKLYFNALLAMLNARERLRAGKDASYNSTACAHKMTHVLNVGMRGDTSIEAIGTPKRDELCLEGNESAVRVQTETTYHTDVDEVDTKPNGHASILPL